MKTGKISVVIDGHRFSFTVPNKKNGKENGKPTETRQKKEN